MGSWHELGKGSDHTDIYFLVSNLTFTTIVDCIPQPSDLRSTHSTAFHQLTEWSQHSTALAKGLKDQWVARPQSLGSNTQAFSSSLKRHYDITMGQSYPLSKMAIPRWFKLWYGLVPWVTDNVKRKILHHTSLLFVILICLPRARGSWWKAISFFLFCFGFLSWAEHKLRRSFLSN